MSKAADQRRRLWPRRPAGPSSPPHGGGGGGRALCGPITPKGRGAPRSQGCPPQKAQGGWRAMVRLRVGLGGAVALPRRRVEHAAERTYPCTLRLWCQSARYVRHARGQFVYGALVVRGAPGASCPVPPVRTVRRRLAGLARACSGRGVSKARRQRCRGPSPAACQRAWTSAQRETGR